MSLHIIILAAGLGKRMYSSRPKVLHQLGGLPMLAHVLRAAKCLKPEAIHVIYGHGGEEIKKEVPDLDVHWIFQAEQQGTGHAVMQALPFIPAHSQVLILYADVPLIQTQTLTDLIAAGSLSLNLLLATLEIPTGLGRIKRNEQGEVCAIIEEKDATEEQKQIKEIYSGICCAQARDLLRWLPQLNNHNAQGEYYLTDIIAMAVADQVPVVSMHVKEAFQIQGVNNRLQLHQLERIWQQQRAEKLMLAGVSLADASRVDIRGELHCGQDVMIDINAVFIGTVVLGDGCQIGPNCVLNNVTVGKNVQIFANCVLEQCQIDDYCQIGPFARLRLGTQLAEHCKIGNFVETKQAVFAANSKASHLSYLGDIDIGKEVNIGAGTITCNYDGANKHQTWIGDGAFIGSDTQLVAPVKVGAHATIGAGSTIRKDVPAGELTLTKSEQKTISGWKRPKKRGDESVKKDS